MIALVAMLIRREFSNRTADRSTNLAAPGLAAVQRLFPNAVRVAPLDPENRRWPVLNANGQVQGHVLETSPDGDRSIGFSGPTNVLIALDADQRIAKLRILESGDTPEHIRAVENDARFLTAFEGLNSKALHGADIDGVSGATLSSNAIHGSIVLRLTEESATPRFADDVPLADVKQLFPTAAVTAQQQRKQRFQVYSEQGAHLGDVIRTSPAADAILGYGGPTEALVGLDRDGRVSGVAVGAHYRCTYDNEPYVSYVREDEYFRNVFNGHRLEELSELDLKSEGIDGVSGATMTSMAVAEGVVAAAAADVQRENTERQNRTRFRATALHIFTTAAIIAAALLWRRLPQPFHKPARIVLLLAAIGYLGVWRGELVSQAMLVGWAESGIPLAAATSFVLLAAASLLLPVAGAGNVYCSQLCPHGGLQQLIKKRIPWQVHVGRRLGRWLKLVPPLLLFWCVVVAMRQLPFSLVNIEPFDAWLFPVAAVASLILAVVGLVASMFIPMAYCRYGCPTGALLEAVRFRRRWSINKVGDWLPAALLVTAILLALM